MKAAVHPRVASGHVDTGTVGVECFPGIVDEADRRSVDVVVCE